MFIRANPSTGNEMVLWGYTVELILSALLLILASMLLGIEKVSGFVGASGGALIGLVTVLLALKSAFLWELFSKVDAPFYKWLGTRGSLKHYVTAVVYATLVSLLAALFLIFSTIVEIQTYRMVCAFLVIHSVINGFTLVENVSSLMRLNTEFNNHTPNG